MTRAVLTLALQRESDLVPARQRARQVASLLGFAAQDQTRVATAVSEICRNALRYANGGRVEFLLDDAADGTSFVVRVRDEGPGIACLEQLRAGTYRSATGMGLGIVGAERLVDSLDVDTAPGRGTTVTLRKRLPRGTTPPDASAIAAELARQPPRSAADELDLQNRELLATLADLRERQEELERLNRELEETNRGVVALYAELDERAAGLRAADEQKSRFLSHLSHEFRTPVNSIRALSRLLLDRLDGPLTDEQEKQVRYVRKAAESLGDLIDDLLDLGKIEAGRIEVSLAPLELESLLGTLRGMFKPLVTNPDVRLVFVAPADLPTVQWDESKVAQILRNLLSNAVKFTEAGEVRVEACHDEDTDEVIVDVADTGIGISPEHREHVFDEYAQLDHALQRRHKGTGLGLSLARRLAGLLGGSLVLVESEVGAGSRFRLRLPRTGGIAAGAGAAAGADAAADESATASPAPHALIVDDDEASRYVLRRPLEQQGWIVEEATDAADALRRAKASVPGIVLLDLNLPDAPGESVLHALRSAPATRGTPVIVVTARKLGDAERAALDADDVWSKDRLHDSAVADRVRQVLAEARRTPPLAAPREEGERP
jgi:signal transduction histidine kinase/ActR/RegA family two-component response regulator